MLKNILNLDGAVGLTKKEQMNVVGAGGRIPPSLCAEPAQWCHSERWYDPCMPVSQSNYPCND